MIGLILELIFYLGILIGTPIIIFKLIKYLGKKCLSEDFRCDFCNNDKREMPGFKRSLKDNDYNICKECKHHFQLAKIDLHTLNSHTKKEIDKKINDHNKWMGEKQKKRNMFLATRKYGNHIWFDDKNKMFLIPDYDPLVFDYSSIKSCEVVDEYGSENIKTGPSNSDVSSATFWGGPAAGRIVKSHQSSYNVEYCRYLGIYVTVEDDYIDVMDVVFVNGRKENPIGEMQRCKEVSEALNEIIKENYNKGDKN